MPTSTSVDGAHSNAPQGDPPRPASASENTGRWTADEHRLFLQGLEAHGKQWKKIATLIPSRTVGQVRSHAQKYSQKLAKARSNGEAVGVAGMGPAGGKAKEEAKAELKRKREAKAEAKAEKKRKKKAELKRKRDAQKGEKKKPVPEFLCHLFTMLREPSYAGLISWEVPTEDEPESTGGGTAGIGKIVVHHPEALQDTVLGKYYRHSKYSSFQRQLNYFGFKKRLHAGKKGKLSPCSYIHESITADVASLFSLKRRPPAKKRVTHDTDDDCDATLSSLEEPLPSTETTHSGRVSKKRRLSAKKSDKKSRGKQTAGKTSTGAAAEVNTPATQAVQKGTSSTARSAAAAAAATRSAATDAGDPPTADASALEPLSDLNSPARRISLSGRRTGRDDATARTDDIPHYSTTEARDAAVRHKELSHPHAGPVLPGEHQMAVGEMAFAAGAERAGSEMQSDASQALQDAFASAASRADGSVDPEAMQRALDEGYSRFFILRAVENPRHLSPEMQARASRALQDVLTSAASRADGSVDPEAMQRALDEGYSIFFIRREVENNLNVCIEAEAAALVATAFTPAWRMSDLIRMQTTWSPGALTHKTPPVISRWEYQQALQIRMTGNEDDLRDLMYKYEFRAPDPCVGDVAFQTVRHQQLRQLELEFGSEGESWRHMSRRVLEAYPGKGRVADAENPDPASDPRNQFWVEPNRYYVSSTGRLASFQSETSSPKLFKLTPNKEGAVTVCITNANNVQGVVQKKRSIPMSYIVFFTFLDVPEFDIKHWMLEHIDLDPANNKLYNIYPFPTQDPNLRRRMPRSDNKSGYNGVGWMKVRGERELVVYIPNGHCAWEVVGSGNEADAVAKRFDLEHEADWHKFFCSNHLLRDLVHRNDIPLLPESKYAEAFVHDWQVEESRPDVEDEVERGPLCDEHGNPVLPPVFGVDPVKRVKSRLSKLPEEYGLHNAEWGCFFRALMFSLREIGVSFGTATIDVLDEDARCTSLLRFMLMEHCANSGERKIGSGSSTLNEVIERSKFERAGPQGEDLTFDHNSYAARMRDENNGVLGYGEIECLIASDFYIDANIRVWKSCCESGRIELHRRYDAPRGNSKKLIHLQHSGNGWRSLSIAPYDASVIADHRRGNNGKCVVVSGIKPSVDLTVGLDFDDEGVIQSISPDGIFAGTQLRAGMVLKSVNGVRVNDASGGNATMQEAVGRVILVAHTSSDPPNASEGVETQQLNQNANEATEMEEAETQQLHQPNPAGNELIDDLLEWLEPEGVETQQMQQQNLAGDADMATEGGETQQLQQQNPVGDAEEMETEGGETHQLQQLLAEAEDVAERFMDC